MTFYAGRLAAVAYLWMALWASHIFKYHRKDLMPEISDWLSVFAGSTAGFTMFTGFVGIITTLKINRRVKYFGLTLALTIATVMSNSLYIIWFRDRVTDNFTKAVQHMLPGFDLDDSQQWDIVRDRLMIFDIGIRAEYGKGVEDTVSNHYHRYIADWASDVVNWFGVSAVFMPIIAMAITLCLISSIKRANATADAAPDSQVVVEVPPPLQPSAYDGAVVSPNPQYVAPPATFPAVASAVYAPPPAQPPAQMLVPPVAQQQHQLPSTTVTVSFPTTSPTPAVVYAPAPPEQISIPVNPAGAVTTTPTEGV